jgi:hypothetical protein
MLEIFEAVWPLVLGVGGYALLVIQFFKDLLGIKKLEIEISQLKAQMAEKQVRLIKPSAAEIGQYGQGSAEIANRKARSTSSLISLGTITVSLIFAFSQSTIFQKSRSSAPAAIPMRPGIETANTPPNRNETATTPQIAIGGGAPDLGSAREELVSSSSSVVARAIRAAEELRRLQVRPSYGSAFDKVLLIEDAKERVRLAKFLRQSATVLNTFVSVNPQLVSVIEEGQRLEEYEYELAQLEAPLVRK